MYQPNDKILYVQDNGDMVFATYTNHSFTGHHVDFTDNNRAYRLTGANAAQIFPRTNEGLNLAAQKSAQLQMKEALENNEADLLPTEVAYMAVAPQNEAA